MEATDIRKDTPAWHRIGLRQRHSIRLRLSLVICFFFLLVLLLGFFSIGRLHDFNGVSADIRDLWLPNTRLLGDINNFTSDLRAEEGAYLLETPQVEASSAKRNIESLDRLIIQATANYEQLPHSAAEADLYAQFKKRWKDYAGLVRQELAAASSEDKGKAIATYMTTSRTTYKAAEDLLGQLTDNNVASAHQASDRADTAYRKARWLIELAMVFTSLLVAGALFYVWRSISDPLLRLARCMFRLAANETNLEIPGTERQDEIGHMSRAVVVFRNNAIELMRSQKALADQASVLREKLEQEQSLTQLQRNFVSMASHEFRTPLNIIDGQAQRLIKTGATCQPEDVMERAGKIRSAVLRLTSLIENLFNSSRLIDDGSLSLRRADVDMKKLLEEVCQFQREIFTDATIKEDFGEHAVWITGDQKLLFQAFSNILSNAIKYSTPGTAIDVKLARDGDMVSASVQDQGRGIPDHEKKQIFDRYYRGSNVTSIAGTGMGLYLVKMVIELHHGEILVESREGIGTRLMVRIPCRPISSRK